MSRTSLNSKKDLSPVLRVGIFKRLKADSASASSAWRLARTPISSGAMPWVRRF